MSQPWRAAAVYFTLWIDQFPVAAVCGIEIKLRPASISAANQLKTPFHQNFYPLTYLIGNNLVAFNEPSAS